MPGAEIVQRGDLFPRCGKIIWRAQASAVQKQRDRRNQRIDPRSATRESLAKARLRLTTSARTGTMAPAAMVAMKAAARQPMRSWSAI